MIELYVVVENNDPYNGSRVRAYPYGPEVAKSSRNASQQLAYEDNTDQYEPWQKAVGSKKHDPYCFEPFLPKHINIIPKVGDLIKVLAYSQDPNLPKEYIVVNSTVNNISSEIFSEAKQFHINDLSRIEEDTVRTDLPGFNPNIDDIGLISGANSELLLGDNRVIIKAGHQIQDGTIKRVNKHKGIINIMNFQNGYSYKDEEESVLIPPRQKVNSLIEYNLYSYTESNIIINNITYNYGLVFNVQRLERETYTNTISTKNIVKPDLRIIIYFNELDNGKSIFSRIIKQFDNKELDLELNDDFVRDQQLGYSYAVEDNRKPVGGITPTSALDLGRQYYIRPGGNLIQNRDLIRLNNSFGTILQSLNGNVRPALGGNQIIRQTKTVRKLTSNNTPTSTNIYAADTQYLLSYQDNEYLDLQNDEFFNNLDIHQKGGLIDTTEPMVRGNQLLSLILLLIELLLNHGHQDVSDSRNTIDKISVEELNEIKSTITALKKKEKNLSVDNNDINVVLTKLINHHIRIN